MYIKPFETLDDWIKALETENREERLLFIENEIKRNDQLEELIYQEGYAVILISREKGLGFGLTLNENGIWKVNWLPFQ